MAIGKGTFHANYPDTLVLVAGLAPHTPPAGKPSPTAAIKNSPHKKDAEERNDPPKNDVRCCIGQARCSVNQYCHLHSTPQNCHLPPHKTAGHKGSRNPRNNNFSPVMTLFWKTYLNLTKKNFNVPAVFFMTTVTSPQTVSGDKFICPAPFRWRLLWEKKTATVETWSPHGHRIPAQSLRDTGKDPRRPATSGTAGDSTHSSR